MDWTEINIEISAAQVDEAAAIAQMVVPYGIYIEDYSDLRTEAPKIAHIDLIDEELLEKDVTKALIHIYISPDDNPAEASPSCGRSTLPPALPTPSPPLR